MMYSGLHYGAALLVALCGFGLGFAGDAAPPVIDRGNVDLLAPVTAVEFADLPPEAGQIINGRVYLSGNGRRVAVVNRSSQAVFLTDEGELLDVAEVILTEDEFPATFIDGAFDEEGQYFAAVHSAGAAYFISLYAIQQGHYTVRVPSQDHPAALWLDAETTWLEMMPANPDKPPYLAKLPRMVEGGDTPAAEDLSTVPLVLLEHEEAVARTGRLPAPFAVTTGEDGLAMRWNLSTGQRTGTAQLEAVPIYGAMTPDGRYLAWRDPASAALHLLDFETGRDQCVAPLDGSYIPFFLLPMKADVVLGVHVNDEPLVIAWDVATGDRLTLGLYRQCQRPPDMVTLARDGTTLVIGCDAGLEIWRVVES